MVDKKLSELTDAGTLQASDIFGLVRNVAGTLTDFRTTGTALAALVASQSGGSSPTVSLNSPSVGEGNSGTTNLVFTATLLRNGVAGAIAFTWAVTGGTAGAADYVGGALPSGGGSFPAGATSATLTVPIQGETAVEPDETCIVTITLTAYNVSSSGTGTIQNDDTSPVADTGDVVIQTNSVTYNAVSRQTKFAVLRSGDTTGPKTWPWKIQATALAGRVPTTPADFAGAYPSGSVSWAAGETATKYVTVTPASDALPE